MWIQVIILITVTREIVGNWDGEFTEGWQDVSELGFKVPKKGNEKKKTRDGSSGECIETPCDCGASELQCGTLKKLLIKISLKNLVRETNEEYIELKVKFGIGELKLLKDYAWGNCKSSGNEIDRIITKAIKKIEIIPSNNWVILMTNFINSNQELIGLIVMTTIIFLILLWLYIISNSWRAVCLKSFTLLFVISSIWDWVRLYKNALALMEAGLAQSGREIPVECRPKEMTIFQNFFTFNVDACQKFYKLELVHPIWDVNPLTAVVDNISRIIFLPLVIFGECIANFLNLLFSRLPSEIRMPVGIIQLIVIIKYFKCLVQLPFSLGALKSNDLPSTIDEPKAKPKPTPKVTHIEVVNNTSNATSSHHPSSISSSPPPNTEKVEAKSTHVKKCNDENPYENCDQLLTPPGDRISIVND